MPAKREDKDSKGPREDHAEDDPTFHIEDWGPEHDPRRGQEDFTPEKRPVDSGGASSSSKDV